MDQKFFVLLGLLAVSFALLAAAIGAPHALISYPLKIVMLFFALLFDVLAFSSRYYFYILVPFFQQHRRKVVLSNEEPYWLSTSEDSIIKKIKDDFVATVYISIPFYRSATEMSQEEKLEFSRQMSRLVGVSDDPIRYTTELYMMNKDVYIQELKDAIATSEDEEMQLVQQQQASNETQIEIVKGRLSMWRNIMQSTTSLPSIEMMSYASISASGAKEYEAIGLAQQHAREVISAIGSIFGVTPVIVTGRGILRFVEPEYRVPFSTVTEQMKERTEQQVT